MMCPKGHIWQPPPPSTAARTATAAESPTGTTPTAILHPARWQKTRKLVRARDQDRRRLEGVDKPCGGKIEVHHIVGVRQGGVPFDPANSSVSVGYITKTSSMGGSS